MRSHEWAEAHRTSTSAIHELPAAVNTAQPSPNGRWLALGMDTLTIELLPAHAE